MGLKPEVMLSIFQLAMQELEATRCANCGGAGCVDDAESGDIYFKTRRCDHCGGTGTIRHCIHQLGPCTRPSVCKAHGQCDTARQEREST